MKGDAQPDPKNSQSYGQVSANKDLVWVQCKEYRCMAYLDATGQWINFYTGEKLMDFVKVIG